MSRKHKHQNRKQTQSDRMAQAVAADKYDRRAVINWILDWHEMLNRHNEYEQADNAWAWAETLESASVDLFNSACDILSQWPTAQEYERSISIG